MTQRNPGMRSFPRTTHCSYPMPLTLLPTNDAEKEDQRDEINGVKAGRKKEYGINRRYVERQKQQRPKIGLGARLKRRDRSVGSLRARGERGYEIWCGNAAGICQKLWAHL